MEFSFKNRYGLSLVGDVYVPENSKGLSFVQHGLSGARIQKQIIAMKDELYNAGYTVVVFDSTHSFGDSDGLLEQASLSKHADDLEDVIGWASSQPFYKEPFVLMGHSLGGASILRYAAKFPDKLKAIAPLSALVSGVAIRGAWADILPEWQRVGYIDKKCSYKANVQGKISWSFLEDCLNYNFVDGSCLFSMPTLLVVGELDDTTPLQSQIDLQKFSPKSDVVNIVMGCGHTFKTPEHLIKLRNYIKEWLSNL